MFIFALGHMSVILQQQQHQQQLQQQQQQLQQQQQQQQSSCKEMRLEHSHPQKSINILYPYIEVDLDSHREQITRSA